MIKPCNRCIKRRGWWIGLVLSWVQLQATPCSSLSLRKNEGLCCCKRASEHNFARYCQLYVPMVGAREVPGWFRQRLHIGLRKISGSAMRGVCGREETCTKAQTSRTRVSGKALTHSTARPLVTCSYPVGSTAGRTELSGRRGARQVQL